MATLSSSTVHSDEEDAGLITSQVDDIISPEVTSESNKLRQWLNKSLRVEMTDGRVLVGVFLCTDRDANIILGSCGEFLSNSSEEARILGLVMVPGRHIVSIHLDTVGTAAVQLPQLSQSDLYT